MNSYPDFERGPNRRTPEVDTPVLEIPPIERAVAEFTLIAGTELPAEVVEFLESQEIPYFLSYTDSPQPVRLLTDTGIYEGSSILDVLGSEEFRANS